MGKVTSLYGKTTGKIGSIVFATSGGETIAREYNPHVANPSTMAQVNQRARMKLMSQISACLNASIVMQKDGLVSKRNKFTKKNMDACYASNGTAQITYENVQLTEGAIGLPALRVSQTLDDEPQLRIELLSAAAANINRVVYSVYEKTDESRLSLILSNIVERDSAGVFSWIPEQSNSWIGRELVVYAYGMIDTSEQATARYSNMRVENGQDIATLVGTRAISYTDYQFTQTRGITIGTNGQPVTPSTPGNFRVFVTASGEGTVSGGGSYTPGTKVTLTATPNSGARFVKWVRNGETQTYSTSNPLVIDSIQNNFDLVAIFNGGGQESL